VCGFVAWIDARGVDHERLVAMRDTLRHRGPDDAGTFRSPDGTVGLGFRRLSIIDLSPAGHQPMANADGSAQIVFNGEVYNFRELRAELTSLGHVFRSRTDTEVVLHAYEQWGESCVARFIGMFSFAIWSLNSRTLFAARDRLGIKPLYYAASPQGLILASEVKAIVASPNFDRSLDRSALREYLARGYVSSPRSIFVAVRSLPPGHTLSWTRDSGAPVLQRYWNPLDFYPQRAGLQPSEDDLVDELDELLRSSVKYRLVSDVPLGAFLSGGVDSSVVVALMRQVGNADIKTFTIGFNEATFDEAKHAEAIARHLGTTHTRLVATQADALGVITRLPQTYDEPFADSSQIPTCLVSHLTRQHVTVALSGDGGDELFCGYENYRRMERWQRAWTMPQWLRSTARWMSRVVPSERARLALHGLAAPTVVDFADYYAGVWRPQEIDLLAPSLRGLSIGRARDLPDGAPVLDALMLTDLQRYLPHDILTKVDRASMAAGLEARVPLLDHRVVEFAIGLPLSMKRRGNISKYLLRRVLDRYVPRNLVERPKQGFGVPLDSWLRGNLRSLLEEHLDPKQVESGGLFEPAVVRAQLDRFLAGRCGHSRVWSLLMFQMWWKQGQHAS